MRSFSISTSMRSLWFREISSAIVAYSVLGGFSMQPGRILTPRRKKNGAIRGGFFPFSLCTFPNLIPETTCKTPGNPHAKILISCGGVFWWGMKIGSWPMAWLESGCATAGFFFGCKGFRRSRAPRPGPSASFHWLIGPAPCVGSRVAFGGRCEQGKSHYTGFRDISTASMIQLKI